MTDSIRTLRNKILTVALFSCVTTALGAADRPLGLTVTFKSGASVDTQVLPNVQLFVPKGESATPFLAAGPITATWSGFLALDLRSEYTFHAEFSGKVKMTVGESGAVALEGKSTDGKPLSGSVTKLNKGANPFKVEYQGPAEGDAFLRLFWSNKEVPVTPIPLAVLSHDSTPELERFNALRKGRDLFAELRCAKCHEVPGATMPELAADAPNFVGIGARRQFDWLARWILNPHALRPGTPMPAVFAGDEAKANSEAVAAYLMSLKGETTSKAVTGDAAIGRSLFARFHCAACHLDPESTEAVSTETRKISHKEVRAKFSPGALVAFLRRPDEHFHWIRMPNFRLSEEEAANLAAYLESKAEGPAERAAPTDEGLLKKGKQLVETTGCLNCHGGTSQFKTKPLSEIVAANSALGCLADELKAGAKSPKYTLSAEQRSALRAFMASDRSSLGRHTAADFLERHAEALSCRECHDHVEGVPKFDLMVGKLKPEWTAKFIAGNDPTKPRPWLEARMPGFPAHAEALATGLTTRGGLAPKSATDVDPENLKELTEAGRKLVSANGGLSCTQCHSVGEFGATAVFEAPGINLAYSADRLQPSYFIRWLRSPQSVDPETKMPGYFDIETGASPLSDILGGDGPKTIQAVWEYLRLRDKMPKPE